MGLKIPGRFLTMAIMLPETKCILPETPKACNMGVMSRASTALLLST